jgi:hypothetical protein
MDLQLEEIETVPTRTSNLTLTLALTSLEEVVGVDSRPQNQNEEKGAREIGLPLYQSLSALMYLSHVIHLNRPLIACTNKTKIDRFYTEKTTGSPKKHDSNKPTNRKNYYILTSLSSS